MAIIRNQYSLPLSVNARGEENKKQPALEDDSLMPFGKYKEEPMSGVPATYLLWLWQEGCSSLPVKNYIWNSRHAINDELGHQAITSYKV